MNKKGANLPIENIIKAIIVIALIFVASYIITHNLQEPIKKLFGMGGELIKNDTEVAVTEAEYTMTVQKTVSNSVNAMACAINSISMGQTNYSSCAEPYNIYTAELPKKTADETSYAQIIGNSLLDCYKNYKQSGKELKSLLCYSISPDGNEFEIQPKAIQEYLKVLEDAKDKDADDLVGSWFFGAGKEYSIILSKNILKKDSVICLHNKNIILTDDRTDCGMIEEVKCEAGEKQYGATCVKCEKEEMICCEYCLDSSCNTKPLEWLKEEDCSQKLMGTKIDNKQCSQIPTGIMTEGGELQTFIPINVKCTITNFLLPSGAGVIVNAKGDSLVVGKISNLLKKEEEGVNFNIFPSRFDFISMNMPSGPETKIQLAIISQCKTDLELKREYCKGKIYNDEYVLKYEKDGKTYLQPVLPLSLKNQERFSYWGNMTNEEKIKALKGTDAVANNGFAMAITGNTTLKRASDLVKNNKEIMKDSILLYFAPNMNYFINHMINTYYWAFAKANDEDKLRTNELNFFCKIGWPIPPAEEGWRDAFITAEPNCKNYNFKTLTDAEYKAFMNYVIDFYFTGKENLNNLQFYYKFTDGAEIKITDALQVTEMYNALDVVLSTELAYWPTAKETVDEYVNFLNGKSLTICSNQDYYYQQICSSYSTYFRTAYKGEKNMLEYLGKQATYGFIYFEINDIADISQLKKTFTGGYEYSSIKELQDWQEVQKEGNQVVVKETVVPCISLTFTNLDLSNGNTCYMEAMV
jgi:hypothetical protein